jgi:hypothetical protein
MKPLNDYRHIRGVCYSYLGDEERMRRELGYGARVGLNSIRFWTSAARYESEGDAYIQGIKRKVQIAYECGYTSMPILFNGNGMTNDDEPKTLSPEYRKIQEEFCEKMIEALKDEPGLLMWDVMNEPMISYFLQQSPPEKRAERRERVNAFIAYFIDFIRQRDPVNAITVGYALTSSMEPTVGLCDVISFHNYDRTYRDIKREFQRAKETAEKYGKPFMNTETGCLARANPYDLVLKLCEEYNCGWYLFELMIYGRCDTEHGIFYPDGTVRDPATIAAMFGCYRKRDGEGIVVPLPNREGVAEWSINRIKKALKEYTCDCFDYRRSNPEELLEACEEAANLLECCDMIPMATPPTYLINKWRKEETPDLDAIRRLAYDLANRLKDICQIL